MFLYTSNYKTELNIVHWLVRNLRVQDREKQYKVRTIHIVRTALCII